MKEDNEVAIADTVKMMRVRRPQIIPTLVMLYSWVDPKVGQGSRPPPWKTPVDICFLRITSTDPPREAIEPLLSNCFSRKDCRTLSEIR